MPALLELYPCPACGGRHDFLDPDATAFKATAVYLFTCPVTDAGALLEYVAADGCEVSERTPSAVPVRRIDMPPGI